MQTVYGITNVLGPYTGSLKKSGTLQLLDEQGSVLLTVSDDGCGMDHAETVAFTCKRIGWHRRNTPGFLIGAAPRFNAFEQRKTARENADATPPPYRASTSRSSR